ncbi:sigma-54 interaction domain-containing protein [Halomonas elongata]|uniref:sigma-54 interaction domain-containing protein n=1 Tax=Halomonas elongata TaxID=2746 RepID=UPI0038D35D92
MLEVWREACRHIEIAESVAAIADQLSQWLPIKRLLLRRLDPITYHLETVADALGSWDESRDRGLTELSSDDIEHLMQWCQRGELARCASRHNEYPFALAAIPNSLTDNVLIGPLISEHDTVGLLIMQLHPDAKVSENDEVLCKRLLEPFAVALENDRRLRELKALRESAEADKRSLLSRLGRDALGDTVIGADNGLRQVMQRVQQVADSDAAVLVLGETGSGKEVIARSVHQRSTRAGGPFIRVNCGAIPPELIDSELFGHEKGSFTGAVSRRRGWFERADEGTLFLDEIGELPMAAQVRLLRVLQDGSFERVGGETSIQVDVRVVAATNNDLARMVQRGEFREDLWYRIAVFPIVLPPLRERSEDIPALAEHFAERAARRFGMKPQVLSAHDLSLLAAYPWPGNVREFNSVLERAVILDDGERLDVSQALGVASETTPTLPQSTSSNAECKQLQNKEIQPLDVVIRSHIERALVASRGRIEGPEGAADILRINPHTLRARMRKLAIDWSRYRQ